jgi:hypothetical protein
MVVCDNIKIYESKFYCTTPREGVVIIRGIDLQVYQIFQKSA